ncbi:unnamed protein product [Acidithrix sp. C25]|nr:unnamed protein product [Acidithrix sp. C25]
MVFGALAPPESEQFRYFGLNTPETPQFRQLIDDMSPSWP